MAPPLRTALAFEPVQPKQQKISVIPRHKKPLCALDLTIGATEARSTDTRRSRAVGRDTHAAVEQPAAALTRWHTERTVVTDLARTTIRGHTATVDAVARKVARVRLASLTAVSAFAHALTVDT